MTPAIAPAPPTVNVLDVPLEPGPDNPPGYRMRGLQIGPLVEAASLGASIYELKPSNSIAPYHYEYGNEEWLIVLEGTPVLRHAEGEDELEPGDAVCFPDGPEGAHKVMNRSEQNVRVLMLSTKNEPSVVVFPDSDKLAIPQLRKVFKQADAAGYWDDEA